MFRAELISKNQMTTFFFEQQVDILIIFFFISYRFKKFNLIFEYNKICYVI